MFAFSLAPRIFKTNLSVSLVIASSSIEVIAYGVSQGKTVEHLFWYCVYVSFGCSLSFSYLILLVTFLVCRLFETEPFRYYTNLNCVRVLVFNWMWNKQQGNAYEKTVRQHWQTIKFQWIIREQIRRCF